MEQVLNRNLQRPRDGLDLEVGHRPLATFDLGDLRLIELQAESCEPADHVVLRYLGHGGRAEPPNGGTSDVAAVLLVLHGALEGALILLLFGERIILPENKITASLLKASPNKPIRILCADDHTLVGEAIARVFTTAGYRVERAEDGLIAWQRIAPDPGQFDVVVADHQLPHLNGLALVRLLREAKFPGRIIVYSAALSATDEASYRALAVDALVHKGPDSAKILAIVEAFHGEGE